MGQLFGTDGIRGVANKPPMTPEVALQVGKAITRYFNADTTTPRIVVGKDTRVSGDMFESAIVAGVCAAGGDALTTGILPTPGVAFVAKTIGAEAALVISASHNPYYDNGIKVFRGDGFKLSDDVEQDIERSILKRLTGDHTDDAPDNIGQVRPVGHAKTLYSDYLKSTMPSSSLLQRLNIVLDCANGATSEVAPPIFSGLGATVMTLCNKPDGKNINVSCGSEHLEKLAEAVVSKKAHVGFGFDGDGDRVLCVDEHGNRVSGDTMLAICAKELKRKGRLTRNTVVSTVMSNIGLVRALKDMDVHHVMAQVGDRYVLQAMLKSGATVGSEDSGHMIFLDDHTTGDGILAALKIAQCIQETGRPLSELAAVMTVYPQTLINIEVKHKPPLETISVLSTAIQEVESALGDEGRVLTRYSGTQPMCRIMVEGPTREKTEKYCQQIAKVVQQELG